MTFLHKTDQYNITFNNATDLETKQKMDKTWEFFMTNINFKDEGSHIIEAVTEGTGLASMEGYMG